MEDTLHELIDESISSDGSHSDVAKVIYELYKNVIKYSKEDGTTKYQWYILENDIWIIMHEGFKLRNLLSTEISQKFWERAYYWSEKNYNIRYNYYEYQRISNRSKILNEIAKKLKNTGYKASIMKECSYLFIK
jgi:hypothetical protein